MGVRTIGLANCASLGHEADLIAAQFVKPYVKRENHDAHDAEAICEAASRPGMCCVPVKCAEQQAAQSVKGAGSGVQPDAPPAILHILFGDAFFPAGRDVAEIGVEEVVRTHHGEPGIDLPLLTLSTAVFILS